MAQADLLLLYASSWTHSHPRTYLVGMHDRIFSFHESLPRFFVFCKEGLQNNIFTIYYAPCRQQEPKLIELFNHSAPPSAKKYVSLFIMFLAFNIAYIVIYSLSIFSLDTSPKPTCVWQQNTNMKKEDTIKQGRKNSRVQPKPEVASAKANLKFLSLTSSQDFNRLFSFSWEILIYY